MQFRHILVPLDFSDNSKVALRLAISIARSGATRLTLLHVGQAPGAGLDLVGYGIPFPNALFDLHEQMAFEQNKQMNRIAREEIPPDVPWAVVVREGEPADQILVESGAGDVDLLVMGTHGRTGVERLLLGSVTERVIRGAAVPVMVTR